MTVTLHLGDCLDVMKTLADASVDAVITDPPYGIGLKQKHNDCRGKTFDNGDSLKASITYEDSPELIADLIGKVMPEILRIARRAVVFCGQAMLWKYPEPNSIGCVYLPNGAGRTKWGFQCFQPILFYGKDPFLQRGLGGRPNSFKTEQRNREMVDHPCPKPTEWMEWAVKRASFEGETILDPFAGSGTTGVACVKLNRNFIGIEINPQYYAIAQRRIQEAQAQLAMPLVAA